jgi:FkbM family methyltransferase
MLRFLARSRSSPTDGQASAPSRAARSIGARDVLGDDFFGGWSPDDVALFESFRTAAVEASPGFVVDFLGVRTRIDFVPWARALNGQRLLDPPVPDDSLRAEAIEYFALLSALRASSGPSFALVELGASYGPWICAAAVVARRLGKSRVSLVAIEASSTMVAMIPQHLADNGIGTNAGPADVPGACEFQIRILHGAVWTDETTLYFPRTLDASDNGSQATTAAVSVDYIGRSVESEAVTAVTLARALDGIELVDLLHVDIQGSEASVVPANVALLGARVRRLYIGTHSRWIDGLMMKTMHEAGWTLVRERPCRLAFSADKPTLEGMTTRDGGQLWLNPALG